MTFQFPISDGGETIDLVDLGGDAVVEIIPRGQNSVEANARLAHIAVATDDARKAYELAIKAGRSHRANPTTANWETLSVCTAFVNGPDGELIECFQTK